MRSVVPILLLGALAAAGLEAHKPEPTAEEQIARITKGAAPGKPTTCINQPMVQSSQRIDSGMIYRIGRTFYVNRLGGDCRIGPNDILITSTPSTQLCRGDIARLVDNQTRLSRGSCIFGDFVPYERPR